VPADATEEVDADDGLTAAEIRKLIQAYPSKVHESHPHVLELRKQLAQKERQDLDSKPGPIRLRRAEARISSAKHAVDKLVEKQTKVAAELVKLQESQAALVAQKACAEQDVLEAEQAHRELLRDLQAAPTQPLADNGLGALAAVAQTLPKEKLEELGFTADAIQKMLEQLGAHQKQMRAEQLAAAEAAALAAETAAAAAPSKPAVPTETAAPSDKDGDAGMGHFDDEELHAIIKHLGDINANEDPKTKFAATKGILLQRRNEKKKGRPAPY